MAEATYCPDCKRIEGIGCACGLSFAEKIKGTQIDTRSLKTRDEQRRGKGTKRWRNSSPS